MAGAGFGIKDSAGDFVTKLEGDGDAKIGNSAEDVIQITGSLKVNGSIYADDYNITAPTATDLLHSTAITLTPSTSLHFIDASGVTLDSGKDYFEITLADGTTDGQHLQLAITTAANKPVKLLGDTGGAKAQGTVSFSGVAANGQTVSFPNVGGGTTYTVTWDASLSMGSVTITSDTNVTAGIDGAGSADDMGYIMYIALDLGIQQASWPFTIPSTIAGTSVTVTQTSAGTSGNQTITENSDNTTVTGFSGVTTIVEGSINSSYGIALAGTAANGGLIQGTHLIYDTNSAQWQIIAGTQLTS